MKSRIRLGLALLTCVLLSNSANAADFRSHLTAFNRFFGWGWSDGYHAGNRHMTGAYPPPAISPTFTPAGPPATAPTPFPRHRDVGPDSTWHLPSAVRP